MNRLALLPISTSDDGKLCGEDCPALGKLEEGEPYCGAWGLTLRDKEDENGDDTRLRLQECIEATFQSDRLVAVRDAAEIAIGVPDEEVPRALLALEKVVESTRAETEGK